VTGTIVWYKNGNRRSFRSPPFKKYRRRSLGNADETRKKSQSWNNNYFRRWTINGRSRRSLRRRRAYLRFFLDRKSTRLNSSHVSISYAVFCLKKKKGKVLGSRNTTCQKSITE